MGSNRKTSIALDQSLERNFAKLAGGVKMMDVEKIGGRIMAHWP